jgi:hypothetical protein
MRSLGALGMSIGTSLAIEQPEAAAQIRGSDVILFNLLTLIRNAHDAYESKEDKADLKPEQLMEDVVNDLKMLSRWLEEVRKTKPLQLIVYYPSYFSMKFRFPLADLAKRETDNQKKFDKLSDKTADLIYDKYKKLIERTDIGMPSFKGKGIVMTHRVVDLAVHDHVLRLTLMESYTGKLKPYTQWYTKLTGGKELYYLPFNKLTIQIFGDKSTDFASSSKAIKDLVKKLAQDSSWTPATTVSRCRLNINMLNDGIDKAALLKML